MENFEEEEEKIKKEAVSDLELRTLKLEEDDPLPPADFIAVNYKIEEKLKELNEIIRQERTEERQHEALQIIQMISNTITPKITKNKELSEVENETICFMIDFINSQEEDLAGIALYFIRKLSFMIPDVFTDETAAKFVEAVKPIFGLKGEKDVLLRELIITVGNIAGVSTTCAMKMFPLLEEIIGSMYEDLGINEYHLFAIRNFVRQCESKDIGFEELYTLLTPYLTDPPLNEDTLDYPIATIYAICTVNDSLSHKEAKEYFMGSSIPSLLDKMFESCNIQVENALLSICIKAPEASVNVSIDNVINLLTKSGADISSNAATVLTYMIENGGTIEFDKKLKYVFDAIMKENSEDAMKYLKFLRILITKCSTLCISDLYIGDFMKAAFKILESYNDEAILCFLDIITTYFNATLKLGTSDVFSKSFDEHDGGSLFEELTDFDNPDVAEKAAEFMKLYTENLSQ